MASNPPILIDIDNLISDITRKDSWFDHAKLRYCQLDNKKETWQQVYEILKARADKSDAAAIECIYLLGYYRCCCNIWERFDIKTEPIIKYLSMLPVDKMIEIFGRSPELINDYIVQIVVPMKDKMAEMQREIQGLEAQIKYMPGGDGYQAAKQEFCSIAGK